MSEGFKRAWKAEVLQNAPLIAPARQVMWPMRIAGEEEALERGAVRVMVRPVKGEAYLVTAALGFKDGAMPTGVFGCPDEESICVVAGGYGYVADARTPERCTLLQIKPVVEVIEVVEAGVLVFVGFHTVLGWGREGMAWETERLSWEGLRVTEIEGEEMRGFGWDLMKDEEVEFRLNLRTGRSAGGAFVQG